MATHEHLAIAGPFLRREPRQKRSREKVTAILDAAESLLGEVGYRETVANPERLIERAGVTGGSFYAYFASTDAVMQALGRLHLEDAREIIESLAARTYAGWREALTAIVDAYAEYWRQPAVRELWINPSLGPEAAGDEYLADIYVASKQRELLQRAAGGSLNGSETQWQVAEELGSRLLQLAFTRDPAGDPAIIVEIKKALIAYVSSFETAAAIDAG